MHAVSRLVLPTETMKIHYVRERPGGYLRLGHCCGHRQGISNVTATRKDQLVWSECQETLGGQAELFTLQ